MRLITDSAGDLWWYIKSEKKATGRLFARTRRACREFVNDLLARLRA